MPKVQPQTYQNLVVRGQTRATQYRESNVKLAQYAAIPRSTRGRVVHYNPWGDGDPDFILQTMKDYLGYTSVQTLPAGHLSSGGKYFARTIPWEHPNAPNFLFAEQLPTMDGDVMQDVDAGGMGRCDELETVVQFGTFPYQILTDDELTTRTFANTNGTTDIPDEATLLRYVSFRYQTAARYEMVPSTSPLVWTGQDGLAVSTRRAVLFVEGDLRIKHWQIPVESIPQTAIGNSVGNTSTFWPLSLTFAGLTNLTTGSLINYYLTPPGDLTFAKDRLVCMTPTIGEPYRMADGNFAVDIEYWFKHYPKGANRMYQWAGPPGFAGFVPGFHDVSFANGTLLFPRLPDFNALFRPEP